MEHTYAQLKADVSHLPMDQAAKRRVCVQTCLRKISVRLAEEAVDVDMYVAFTWRQLTENKALLARAHHAGTDAAATVRSGSLTEMDEAYAEAVRWIPQGEFMNALDDLSGFDISKPASVTVFDVSSRWGLASTYGSDPREPDGDVGGGMVPIRVVYRVRGAFAIENVARATTAFPFDVHYISIVFESWEEHHAMQFVPSPFDEPHDMLDNTTGVPLFPLPQWDLVHGQVYGLEAGLKVWSFTRQYTSDIFTTNVAGTADECAFSNAVLTFVVGRNPVYWLRQVVPILLVLAATMTAILLIPVDVVLSDRIAAAVTMILTAVAFKFELSGSVPPSATPTRLDTHFNAFYAMNGLVVIGTAISNHLSEHAPLVDAVTTGLFVTGYAASLIHLLAGYRSRPKVVDLGSKPTTATSRPGGGHAIEAFLRV